MQMMQTVAPARERGLKLFGCCSKIVNFRRSREGAWIEIDICINFNSNGNIVAPARERGLKLSPKVITPPTATVAPARERGLK